MEETGVFVDEARAVANAVGRGINPKSTLGELLTWATGWSDRMDPFRALREEIARSGDKPTEYAGGGRRRAGRVKYRPRRNRRTGNTDVRRQESSSRSKTRSESSPTDATEGRQLAESTTIEWLHHTCMQARARTPRTRCECASAA